MKLTAPLLWLALALVSGCAPASPAGSRAISPQQPQPTTPKVLTIALQREPANFGQFGGESAGSTLAPQLLHNGLVSRNNASVYEGQLAAEQISQERGTWRVNPDGSMDTTWKLRPNVKWHDGATFSSADLLFAFTVYKDRDLPNTLASAMAAAESANAPDALTFQVHWSRTDVKADQAPGLTPLPRHLLEDTYLADKAALPSLPYFTTGFVGLGPYRLTRWEQGVQMETARFTDYWRGVAAIDQVVLKYISDPTALVANILAGAVDVVTPPGVDVEAALSMQERWAGTGNQVIMQVTNSVNSAYSIQLRPEHARPRNGLTNRDVREALYRGIDRQAMAEALTHGLAPLADSWVPPYHAVRKDLESRIPQYPYDLSRAQQLLAGAGWVRGPDGVLTHQSTGERFVVEVSGQQRAVIQKQQPIIAEAWKALGAEAEIHITPPALNNDRQYESLRPGVVLGRIADNRFFFDRALHSRETASEANRWGGRNKGGYANAESDRLLDQLSATIDDRERLNILRQMVQVQIGDVALMPFFWEVEPVLALASVKIPPQKTGAEYIFEWEKE